MVGFKKIKWQYFAWLIVALVSSLSIMVYGSEIMNFSNMIE